MRFPNPSPLLRPIIHQWLFFSGLALIAISLPNSVYFMSVGQFVLAGNWLLEGKYRDKIIRFGKNIPAVLLGSLYLLYLVSGFWSENTQGFLRELRISLPILTLTFLIASTTAKISVKQVWALLVLFIASVVVTSFIGVLIFDAETAQSGREYSPFISHIRFGMMIVLSVFLIPWIIPRLKSDFSDQVLGREKWLIIGGALVIAWLITFLFMMQTLSSFVFLGAGLVFSGLYLVKHYGTKWLLGIVSAAGVLAFTGFFGVIFWLISMITAQNPVDFDNLPTHTPRGNPYHSYLNLKDRENGTLVFFLIAEDELREEWNKRSTFNFDQKDKKGQDLRYTLYRYLASKGLTKDMEGVNQLTQADIEAVENGIANHLYTKWPGLLVRLHQTIWEIEQYRQGREFYRHSLAKRFEFWKAAITAIKLNPVAGWGAGDLMIAMNYGFMENETILKSDFWHNPHNQYLSWAIMLGVPVTLFIILLLVWIPFATKAWNYYPTIIFMFILLLSMLSEDTIRNQAGLTFFIFFYLFFNFILPKVTTNNTPEKA